MFRARLLIVVLLAACTPLRPLSIDDVDGGRRMDAAMGDARVPDGATPDGPLPDTRVDDTGTGDAGVDAGGCASVETCNGIDDDCNAATTDGSSDPMLGTPCDGADADACNEGTFSGCTAGALVCGDATTDTPESCGVSGADEDCDGRVDEAGAVGATTFYLDEDGDGVGSDVGSIVACSAPPTPPRYVDAGGDCDDTNSMIRPGRGEDCNAIDDDCDGMIDDGASCGGCTVRTFGGHTYLFCNNERPWDIARTQCMASGYHLATIEDSAENSYLTMQAAALGLGGPTISSGVWFGMRRVGTTFEWTDGSPVGSYQPWDTGEPNMSGDCGRFRVTSRGWWDSDCTLTEDYICETP